MDTRSNPHCNAALQAMDGGCDSRFWKQFSSVFASYTLSFSSASTWQRKKTRLKHFDRFRRTHQEQENRQQA
jgi:hypothetical protein